MDFRIVDFGHYNLRERFENPILSLAQDRFMNCGGTLFPSSPHWVQPDPKKILNPDVIRHRPLDSLLADWCGVDPNETNVSGLTEEAIRLSCLFANNEISTNSLLCQIDQFIETLFS